MCSLNGVNAHMGSLEYNAAKEALRALTRTAAREWAPTGVTVNAICPAAKSQAFFRAIGDYPELERWPMRPTRWAAWATRTTTSPRSRSCRIRLRRTFCSWRNMGKTEAVGFVAPDDGAGVGAVEGVAQAGFGARPADRGTVEDKRGDFAAFGVSAAD
jgi:NAD(P)-dependent dehydrogenase (short-subunit alcohol dehydrogenase family)